MKNLVMLSAAVLLSLGTAQACEMQKRFLAAQLAKPTSAIALELKGKDVVAVKKVERSDAKCDFAVQSELLTDDGDLAECYTQVRVERKNFRLMVKFLNQEQRTTCFL